MAAPPPAPFLLLLAVAAASLAGADDPYRYFTWTVTYGPITPLGTTQQVRSLLPHSIPFHSCEYVSELNRTFTRRHFCFVASHSCSFRSPKSAMPTQLTPSLTMLCLQPPAGHPDQRAVPRPTHRLRHQRQPRRHRPQRPRRTFPPHLERHQAAQELVAGRRRGHQLRHPAGGQLHLPFPDQGPDRHLLLLPFPRPPPRRRRLRRAQRLPAPRHPRPVPATRGGLHAPRR